MRVTLGGLAIVVSWLACLPAVAAEYKWTLVKNPAAFLPRDGAGALTFNNRMWLVGGWNSFVYPKITTNEVWKSTDGANWTLVNRAPWEPRHSAGYVVLNNKMWIVGGDPRQLHFQPDVWNTSDGVNWTQVTASAPWGQRNLHYTVVHNGKIWVMGGQTMPQFVSGVPEAFYNDVWNSSDGVNWTQVTAHAPWSPRGMYCGSVVFKGRMWLLGGGTYDTPQHPTRLYYNEVWSSKDGLDWRKDTTAPWAPRQYHNVAVFDNRMWVMAGFNANLGAERNDVWYSSDGVNWTELPNTPWMTRHAASVFVYDNTLWMVAGSKPGTIPMNDVWRLDKVPEVSEKGDILLFH